MLAYLASPYTHSDPAIREARAKAACCAAAALIKQGHHILAPIGFFHYIHLCGELVADWDFWNKLDYNILCRCDALWVLLLQGWDTSTGIKAEMKFARYLGMPISYVDPATLEISPCPPRRQ